MKLADFGDNVSKDYNNLNGGLAFDPATILVIIEVITEVMAMFEACNLDAAGVHKMTSSPSIFQKILLRRAVRNVVGTREFRKSGENLVDALLNNGKRLTEADIKELLSDSEEFVI